MASPRIEHVNVTVRDPRRMATLMEQLFGWQIRWEGPAINDGHTTHVGSDDSYPALYRRRDGEQVPDEDFRKGRPLNHIGIEVDDLDATERKVIEAGLVPFNHGDYEPGRRFYFLDFDGTKYEVVSSR